MYLEGFWQRLKDVEARSLYLEDEVHKLYNRTFALEKILNCVMPRVGFHDFQSILDAAGFTTNHWINRGAWASSTLQ